MIHTLLSLRSVVVALGLCLVGCGAPDGTVTLPEDNAFAALDGGTVVELLPTASVVTARCADALARTFCSAADARRASLACRAQLSPDERAQCDAGRGCAVPYAPTRAGVCAVGPTYPTLERCAAPVDDNCGFYRACLDAAHPCGPAGYALGFGEPLCYLFIDRREEFTPAGQRWLRSVRTCLQRALAPLVSRPAASCDALADDAYASHSGCYTEPGSSFCTLPPSDVLRLANLLGPYLGDPRAIAQTRAVAWFCARHAPSTTRIRTRLPNPHAPASRRFWQRYAEALTDVRALRAFASQAARDLDD